MPCAAVVVFCGLQLPARGRAQQRCRPPSWSPDRLDQQPPAWRAPWYIVGDRRMHLIFWRGFPAALASGVSG